MLREVSLTVARGEIVALIGANGAGKTTLLRTVSGLLRPRTGSILFQPEPQTPVMDLARIEPEKIVGLGLAHCPEGRGIFAGLTVKENMLAGAYLRRDKQEVEADLQRLGDLFPVLRDRNKQRAGSLSGGEQEMLAIARSLMSRPRLLLLDEPSLGLAPLVVDSIFQMLGEINRSGTTILLVEQNAVLALELAHRGYVLETGRVSLSGTCRDLASNEMVRQAYLGGHQ